MSEEKFDSWAIIELFGHTRIAGRLTEQTIGGQSFIRVDVPETEDKDAFTRFFGNGAIYSITPVSEEVARVAAKRMQVQPVRIYMPELYLPEPKLTHHNDEYDDDEYCEEPLPF